MKFVVYRAFLNNSTQNVYTDYILNELLFILYESALKSWVLNNQIQLSV